jgi:hypothetical protein
VLLAALLSTAAMMLVAGCGTPTPTPTPTPTITLDPVDVSGYDTQPCTLLTPTRAQRRHLSTPGRMITSRASGGISPTTPGCHWDSDAPRFPPITAGASSTQGLADLDRHDFTYFRDSGMIDGYPDVQTATTPGGPAGGHCTTRVGVGPHATVDVSADYPTVTYSNLFSSDPCADADTMATEIVGGMISASP